jgi:hypothetical protein
MSDNRLTLKPAALAIVAAKLSKTGGPSSVGFAAAEALFSKSTAAPVTDSQQNVSPAVRRTPSGRRIYSQGERFAGTVVRISKGLTNTLGGGK